jgi:hypothetical protein
LAEHDLFGKPGVHFSGSCSKEAKALAVQTQDLWEREILFKIADQWQLLGGSQNNKEAANRPKAFPQKAGY